MGRPPAQHLLRGVAYVWVKGYEEMPEARHHHLQQQVAEVLAAGRTFFEGLPLAGLVLGKGSEYTPLLRDDALPGWGHSVLRICAEVTRERKEGLPCQVGRILRPRGAWRWAASFGEIDLPQVLTGLRLPGTKEVEEVTIFFP